MTNSKKKCITAFGNCRKLEASAAKIISACNTNDAALKVKAKALTVNANNTKHVAAKIDAAIKHASSGRKKRAIASCAAFVVEVGYYNGNLTNNKQANVSSLVKVILAYVPKDHTCSATDVTGLNKAKKAVATISAALTSALAAVQAKLTGKSLNHKNHFTSAL